MAAVRWILILESSGEQHTGTSKETEEAVPWVGRAESRWRAPETRGTVGGKYDATHFG